jgi:hypothetical protein
MTAEASGVSKCSRLPAPGTTVNMQHANASAGYLRLRSAELPTVAMEAFK